MIENIRNTGYSEQMHATEQACFTKDKTILECLIRGQCRELEGQKHPPKMKLFPNGEKKKNNKQNTQHKVWLVRLTKDVRQINILLR